MIVKVFQHGGADTEIIWQREWKSNWNRKEGRKVKKQILKAVVTLLCYCALEAVILANDNSMTMYEKGSLFFLLYLVVKEVLE